MAEYIERDGIKKAVKAYNWRNPAIPIAVSALIDREPAIDAAEVVRCQDCIHAVPFDRNCELNASAYLHCGLLRGEEVKYVWHKYKKYYKDYSVVDRDGFCDSGVKMDGKGEGE